MDQSIKFPDGQEQTVKAEQMYLGTHVIGSLNIAWAREAWPVQGRWSEGGSFNNIKW